MMLSVFTCVDHDNVYVGVASIVIARDEDHARELLREALEDRDLNPDQPFTLQRVDIERPKAIILQDGDY